MAQITKHGFIFLFDRVTGTPLFPIEERPVPQQALPGEKPWPTQPFPTLPEPFARQSFTMADITRISPEAHQEMSEKFRTIRHAEMFTPPSKEGSWIFPGFDGGGEWGGAAVDPESGILYVNSTELPWSLTMIDVAENKTGTSARAKGHAVYNKHCLSCHGPELQGNGSSFPALKEIGKKYNAGQLRSIIANGRNMMPSFKHLSEAEKEPLLAFLLNMEGKDAARQAKPVEQPKEPESAEALVPFAMTGYNRFLDKDGYPGIQPPWGTLNAVDLNSGKLLWKVPWVNSKR